MATLSNEKPINKLRKKAPPGCIGSYDSDRQYADKPGIVAAINKLNCAPSKSYGDDKEQVDVDDAVAAIFVQLCLKQIAPPEMCVPPTSTNETAAEEVDETAVVAQQSGMHHRCQSLT
eukprot:scaffold28270_cov78-Skeletonema_dohrnii-CCMP3373.AAC.1